MSFLPYLAHHSSIAHVYLALLQLVILGNLVYLASLLIPRR